MVDAKKKRVAKKIAPKIGHKLAKYVRATPLNLQSLTGPAYPSTSHLTLGGQKRKVKNNAKTWYEADDEKKHFKRTRNHTHANPRQRHGATPGTVVILLAGKHRGRRVVLLKTLSTGLWLVTGPFSVNGVPLKRVNPAYAIVTSTKVNLEGVNVAIDDGFFKSPKKFRKGELKATSPRIKKQEEKVKQAAEAWKVEAKKQQKIVDDALLANIKKVEDLQSYLSTRFTLYNNTRPHELKF